MAVSLLVRTDLLLLVLFSDFLVQSILAAALAHLLFLLAPLTLVFPLASFSKRRQKIKALFQWHLSNLHFKEVNYGLFLSSPSLIVLFALKKLCLTLCCLYRMLPLSEHFLVCLKSQLQCWRHLS